MAVREMFFSNSNKISTQNLFKLKKKFEVPENFTNWSKNIYISSEESWVKYSVLDPRSQIAILRALHQTYTV